jgi:hypothetical protein
MSENKLSVKDYNRRKRDIQKRIQLHVEQGCDSSTWKPGDMGLDAFCGAMRNLGYAYEVVGTRVQVFHPSHATTLAQQKVADELKRKQDEEENILRAQEQTRFEAEQKQRKEQQRQQQKHEEDLKLRQEHTQMKEMLQDQKQQLHDLNMLMQKMVHMSQIGLQLEIATQELSMAKVEYAAMPEEGTPHMERRMLEIRIQILQNKVQTLTAQLTPPK